MRVRSMPVDIYLAVLWLLLFLLLSASVLALAYGAG